MLRVDFVGNLGADPEIGTTRKNAPLATLRVAVNQTRLDPTTGERQQSSEWFRVRAGGRLVQLAERLESGGRLLVIGRLEIGQ